MSFTKEKIADLKVKHGENLFIIKSDSGAQSIVRKPTLKELEALQGLLSSGQLMTYNIALYRTCLVEGDKFEDEKNYKDLVGMSGKMAEIIEVATASVEKL
ncbi:hypothetical protein [Empedobacter sp. GD03797]|uniref:hypothetical protein n=1 Tax=Empedobacter sp. GD03797 TaxID=2975382 RepID=UPI002446D134|nr:hypothetical protein [Empedobacter sp. GD03797]MDH1880931.1 hypothetical protein [Empedobacter sp. GD03797]